MRALITAAIVTATLTGCAVSNTQQGQRSLRAQQTLDRYLVGKAAGTPRSCLPSYRSQDMIVVDDQTILFRDGSNRIWRNDPAGGCSGLGRPGTALVTRSFGGTGLCRGEIATVVDTGSGFTVGSCSLGDFVPFEGPRRS
uniref:hypothetical protein n=1 Tax=uncultured Sphingomonas sp. TaxID=158754 RepID=UPI0025EFF0FF|nr:hypothetical protein [uncultured Sphingomonas sp.]